MKRFAWTLLAPLTLFAATAAAEDWPQFRGPGGQGAWEGGPLPVEWGPTRNVAWKRELPGEGWSSPVVADGRVYLTSAVAAPGEAGKDWSLQALCLDAGSGSTLWKTEAFYVDAQKAYVHGKNSHASPTPLVEGGRLYVHFGPHGTACLNLSGKVLWRSTAVKYNPVHGPGGSPILVDDALIFSCDGGDEAFVAALDRNTGNLLWKTPRSVDAPKKFSFSTPLLIEVHGRKEVVSAGSGMVGAYDPKTGAEIWRVRHNGYSVVPCPVYAHGLVLLSSGYDAPQFLAIRPDGTGDVTDTHVAWRTAKGAPLTPSPLVVGDELYLVADGGVVSCLDARTGRPHWQHRVEGHYSASPVYADGKIYVQSEEGTGTVLRAGKEFGEVARNPLDERSLASYAAAKGALFIRTAKHLYRIESR
jgi:outer membrane protein assembly factor BamB